MRGINHSEDFGWSVAPRFGGGGSNVTSTSQTKSDPWTGQQAYLAGGSGTTGVFPSAESLYSTYSPSYYPTSTYSPMTGTQNALIGDLVNNASGSTSLNAGNAALTNILNQGTSGTQGAFNQSQGVLQNEMSPGFTNHWASPGFGNIVANTLASTIPATTSSFIGGGRADSGLAQRAATEGATSAIGQLGNQFYTGQESLQQQAAAQAASNQLNEQTNLQRSAATAPSIDTANVANINAGLTGATMQQTDAQNQLNDLVSRWNYGQNEPLNMLDWYSNLVGGSGYGSSTSNQTTQPYYSNVGSNVLSGASSLASIASTPVTSSGQSLLQWISDRALKKDVRRIGESDSGFPLYAFRYKWEDRSEPHHIGLMAQDVQRRRPEAVTRYPFGLAVDYDKALAA
jgi:hypothetical protein